MNPDEIQQQQTQETTENTPEDKATKLRNYWTEEVQKLNEYLKNLPSVDHLINIVYTKRQEAVDNYYATMSVYNKQYRIYKQNYAQIYNNIKAGSNGIRYTSDQAIDKQIDAQLIAQREVLDELNVLMSFLWETVKSIDGIQYAIGNKIKIHEMMNGLKF